MTNLTPPLPELLTDWLPSQRWFPAKGRDVALKRVGGIRLDDPEGNVGLEVHFIAVDSGERTDVISIPVTYRSEEAPYLEAALLGRAHHEELGERWLYDGAADPVFVTAWLELMRSQGSTLDGRTHGVALAGFENWAPFTETLQTKVLKGEQSNTSVIVAAPEGQLIVKFYRVLASGISPDVEVSAKLTAVGSDDVPATLGWVTGSWQDPASSGTDDDAGTLLTGHVSVLREFIPNSEDAWRTASAAAVDNVDFTREAEELGAVTGRIHQQLSAAFGSRPPSAQERAEFLSSLTSRIRWAWAEARSSVGPFDAAVENILAKVNALDTLPNLQRIHADYHLGQVLHSPQRGWTVLDFEGEPLRPAAERSVPDAPLRDVVGMMRSIDYAAGVALVAAEDAADESAEAGADRREAAVQWAAAASDAFIRGYEKETGISIDRHDPLYLALWLDKALYEVVYEIRNRPRWINVPAAAVRQVLEQAGQQVDDFQSQEDNIVNESQNPQLPAEGTETGPETTAVDHEGTAGTDLAAASGSAAASAAGPVHTNPLPVAQDVLEAVSEGRYYQPHAVLGAHLDDQGLVTIRTLRPLAKEVTAITPDARVPLVHEFNGIWVGTVPAPAAGQVPDYRLEVSYEGTEPRIFDDPYRFLPTLGEMDLYLIGEGRHENLWTVLGANLHHYSSVLGDINGVSFAVWAPNAKSVRVTGDFNGWNGVINAMRSLGSTGVWELFIPGVEAGARYKFQILGSDGVWRDKADPLAKGTEVPPLTGSRVVDSTYHFEDSEWMEARAARDPHNAPMSVYEVHLGSWRLGLGYRELADQLAEYVKWQGFTHVEFMPVAEHPFGGSWGYQVTSYFAPTSRFGHPDDFRYLVDKLHQAGIGVLLDWVPAHFPKDPFALAEFDGQSLYEHGDPFRGEQLDWGTLVFDFGRREVRNFLVANAVYWLEEFHIDGLRVDAVASMLYLDYSRPEGQWRPNIHGGRENLEAISFLQEVNATAYRRVPGIVMIAEESTAFPGVTQPTSSGGLGFGLKWNMGWMHDTLDYMAQDPINRVYHHAQLTFSLVYAYTENFLLPISHDEVVHGKGSLLRKMPGDRWQQLANLRAYLAYQWAHPGKQLIFMGTEFGQEAEWSEQYGLDWYLAETPQHKGVQLMVRQLNEIYRNTPALYDRDNQPAGFQWIDENDGAHNALSFIRWDHQGNPLVCIANFAGTPHQNFRLGLPWAGEWVEALNTDAAEFGGSGVSNVGVVEAVEGPCNGQPASATLTVPPLGVLYLVPNQK